MKKTIALILLSFSLQSQTLIKYKQMENPATTSVNLGAYNINTNNAVNGVQSITSVNGTTTLTLLSPHLLRLIGSASQTVQLPSATTLPLNISYELNNNSTGNLIVVNAGGTNQTTIPSGGVGLLSCQNNSTSNGTWEFHFLIPSNSSFGTNEAIINSKTTIGTGTVAVNTTTLGIMRVKQGSSFLDFGEVSAGQPAIWFQRSTPTNLNFNLTADIATTKLNNTSNVILAVNNSDRLTVNNTSVICTPALRIGSAAAPSATLDVTGTMSVSSTGTVNGNFFCNGDVQARNVFGMSSLQGDIILPVNAGNLNIKTRNASNADIVFFTNGTTPNETMRLTSTGQMSVTGGAKFTHTVGVTTATAGLISEFRDDAQGRNYIRIRNEGAFVNASSNVELYTNIGNVGYLTAQGSGVTIGNAILGLAGSAIGISGNATPIVLAPNGISALTNAMVLNTSNQVGIGGGNSTTFPATLTVYGTMSVSSTTTLQAASMIGTNKIGAVLTATATLDFGSTNAWSGSDLTITVTGAAVGDAVSIGLPASINNNTSYMGWVSATNTVTIRFNNYSGGIIDPPSGTFKATVIKN